MFRDDPMLVERCIRREERAWEEFVERFSGLLYYSARERLRRGGFAFGHRDLEDIVQGVFLEIWEKGRLEGVRERQKIKAWLSVVAQTRALNYMRKKKDRLLRQDEMGRIENIKAVPAGSGSGFDEGMVADLEEAIEGLGAREKIILKLNIMHGKKHREIARFMNMSINTVSTVIARKKKALKAQLKERLEDL